MYRRKKPDNFVPTTSMPEYRVWRDMISRCYNENHPNYKYYGYQGVTVCDRWTQTHFGFTNFLRDVGRRPGGFREYWIDRINPLGNYEPSNVRWAKGASGRKRMSA